MKKKLGIIIIYLLLLLTTSPFTSGYSLSANYLNLSDNVENIAKYDGRILIVDATASWCTACDVQLQNLQHVYDNVDETVSILTLSVDQSDTIAKMAELKERFASPWEFGIDHNAEFLQDNIVSVVPTLFLFNEKGAQLERWEGITAPEEIVGAINSYADKTFDANFDSSSNEHQISLLEQLFSNLAFRAFGAITVLLLVYFLFNGGKNPQHSNQVKNRAKTHSQKKHQK